jgi:hypothetical protein
MKDDDGLGATSTEPGLPATRSAKMVRCSGARIRMLGPLSEEQIAKLQEYLSESGCDAAQVARFCRTFGVETLDQLPAAKFEQAIERIDSYRARRAGGPSREEIDRALEQDPVFRRMKQHSRAGMDFDEAYDFSLAEELAKRRLRPLWLLKRVAERFLEKYEPKLKAQWERDPARDREKIDALARWLKAKGVRACRGKAEELWAEIQGVTIHALRKRRQRRK